MKLIRSFGYAWQGVAYCFKTQLNFKIHLLATVIVITAGIAFSVSSTEWLFIAGCCSSVIMAEMFNTAIEKICDTVSPEINPVIKIIKDVSAGAVLVSAAGSLVIAGIIFLPKIFNLL
ncbi:MAG: diacylglycerol kinase family protein [Ferruginibacter sp.]